MSSAFGGGPGSLDPCPCGSGAPYDRCCGALHRGEAVASTAEQLMRSRYAAYARGLEDYLLATWHPATRPGSLALEPAVEWLRLEVLGFSGGGERDDHGEVEFTAHYREGGRRGSLHERSRFTRRGRRWLYLEGTVD
jgi:SEC-C motif-containing protein